MTAAKKRSQPKPRGASPRRKAFGQHFLIDHTVISDIIDACAITATDHVVEIGPGQLALTRDLIAQNPRKLVCIEKDRQLAAQAQIELEGHADVEVLSADALECDINLFVQADLVVGNLPYSVGTAIYDRLLRLPTAQRRYVLMLQTEVVERIASIPGDRAYGPLAVATALRFDLQWSLDVPPEAFSPPPLVDSRVIALAMKTEPLLPTEDVKAMLRFLRVCFKMPRRKIKAAAKGLGDQAGTFLRALGEAEIDPENRPNTITELQFMRAFQLWRTDQSTG